MLDFDERQGAFDPADRLKGSVLASFSDWSLEFQTERLELAWTVLQQLLVHTNRTQGLAAYIEFLEKASDNMAVEAQALREVIEEDHQRRAH